MGPSGCGKTTTLRMVAGLETPDRGDVLIGGRSVIDVPVYRRNVGMVFQNYALFPHMTVFENIAFGLHTQRCARAEVEERVAEAIRLVRLEEMPKRKPDQLSGGQRQRVALARALVTRPKVLLLDEPLGALDKKLRGQMQVEIRALQRSVGITTIFVTHDQEEALTLSDRVVVMNEGQIAQVGAPQEVYDEPASEFVADFIGSANVLPVTLDNVMADEVGVRFGKHWIVVPRPSGASLAVGSTVKVCVRPEKMKVGGNPTPGVNEIEGRIEDAVYNGVFTHVYIVTEGELRVMALHRNDGNGGVACKPFSKGQVVTVWWPKTSCRLLLT